MYICKKERHIKNNKLHINELKSTFSNNLIVEKSDVENFYKSIDADINLSTIDGRIFELIKKGVLFRIGRGKYSFHEKQAFQPQLENSLIKLSTLIKKQLPFLDFCIWNTKCINAFMVHQPFRFYTILEVEKDAIESVFNILREENKNVYIDPSQDTLDKYVSFKTEPIIITNLVSEAPLFQNNTTSITTLEKLLVDIYCNTTLFAAQQGAEMRYIYKSAFEKYSINEAKLLRYASRRKKKEQIIQLINKVKDSALNND